MDSYGDYEYERPARRFALPNWSVTVWLVVINVAIFFIDAVIGPRYGIQIGTEFGLMPPLEYFGHFSFSTAIGQSEYWRFLSYQFLHAHLLHLAMNMFMLFVFGRFVESRLGSARFLGFYLSCGVAGALFYLLFAATGWVVTEAETPMVGASAGIFGVLTGAAVLAPHARVVLLLFFIIPVPMRVRTLALLAIAFGVYTVWTQGPNAGGDAAHLGGAALGFLLLRYPVLLRPFEALGDLLGPKLDPSERWRRDWQRQRETLIQEVDRIADKIRRTGWSSLNETELLTLRRARREL